MSSTWTENIQKIKGALETGRKASLLYLLIMYVYCVYPAMLNIQINYLFL